MSKLANRILGRHKNESLQFDSATANPLRTWAQALIAEHRRVYVETPDDLLDERRIVYPCDTLEQLLFYRLRAEAWSTWGILWTERKDEPVATWGSQPTTEGEQMKVAAA